MLANPSYHGLSVCRMMMELMQSRYKYFHQQMLTDDDKAIDFYKVLDFERSRKTESMWMYSSSDH